MIWYHKTDMFSVVLCYLLLMWENLNVFLHLQLNVNLTDLNLSLWNILKSFTSTYYLFAFSLLCHVIIHIDIIFKSWENVLYWVTWTFIPLNETYLSYKNNFTCHLTSIAVFLGGAECSLSFHHLHNYTSHWVPALNTPDTTLLLAVI
jgi:hypothetical protein